MELSLKERITIVLALQERVKELGGIVHTFAGMKEHEESYQSAKMDLIATSDLIKKFEEVPF